MKFEFDLMPALVEKKKKYENFHITPIGGPEEIVKWREMQAAKESAYRMRLGDRDTRISQYETEIGQKLASPDIITRGWQEKVAFAMAERKRLAKAEKIVNDTPPWEPPVIEKVSLYQRITGFFRRIWTNSNF